jgi:large subunit ribosomal protein L18e
VVLKRLNASRVNRVPLGLARVIRYMQSKGEKIAVVIGTVTDDIRLDGFQVPKLRIAALKFTEGARARITAAGGECLTIDQLAQLRPTGANTEEGRMPVRPPDTSERLVQPAPPLAHASNLKAESLSKPEAAESLAVSRCKCVYMRIYYPHVEIDKSNLLL